MAFIPTGRALAALSVPMCRASDDAAQEVSPGPQVSGAAWANVAGSVLDALLFKTVAFTLINTGADTLQWRVIAGNDAAFADLQIVQAAADVLAAGVASFSVDSAVWRFYAIEIIDKVPGAHGEAVVRGVAKS